MLRLPTLIQILQEPCSEETRALILEKVIDHYEHMLVELNLVQEAEKVAVIHLDEKQPHSVGTE